MFKFISRVLANTNQYGIINAKIAAPLTYLSNFWITFEIPLINCEINLSFTLPANYYVIIGVNRVTNLIHSCIFINKK